MYLMIIKAWDIFFSDENELNRRQMRWIKFLKDYDFQLMYHPGKTNVVVVDALSCKKMQMSSLMIKKDGIDWRV